MGIFSQDEEPSWSDVIYLEEQVKEFKAENERLRTCLDTQRFDETNQYIKKVNVERKNYKLKSTLQEIKGVVTALYMNNWLQMNETARKSIQLLQDLITKAESEG